MSLSGRQYSSGGLEHHFKDPFGRRSEATSLSFDGGSKPIRSGLSGSHSHSLSRRQGISYRHLFIFAGPDSLLFLNSVETSAGTDLKNVESPIFTHIYVFLICTYCGHDGTAIESPKEGLL